MCYICIFCFYNVAMRYPRGRLTKIWFVFQLIFCFFQVHNNRRCIKFDPHTRLATLGRLPQLIWARYSIVLASFCRKLALFEVGNFKLFPRPKFEAHWRKNVALSLASKPVWRHLASTWVSPFSVKRPKEERFPAERKQLHSKGKWCPIAEQIGHHLPSPAFLQWKGNTFFFFFEYLLR